MQDYNSLRVAVMIWATLVNTQTHTTQWHVFTSYILLAQPAVAAAWLSGNVL